MKQVVLSAAAASSRIVSATITAVVVVACVSVPPMTWPPLGSTALEIGAARAFIDRQIIVVRKQPAAGSLRNQLIEAAEKSHQPILAKRKTYSPPVTSAVIEDVALLNATNAIVTFDVKSGYPPGSGYNMTNNSQFTYVYALYKHDGAWKVVADYQLLRFQVVA